MTDTDRLLAEARARNAALSCPGCCGVVSPTFVGDGWHCWDCGQTYERVGGRLVMPAQAEVQRAGAALLFGEDA